MKRIAKYIILIIILLLILIGYYLIVSNEFDNLKIFFEGGLNILQVAFSVVIAYLLYDRFGTTKRILDKQNDLIIEFIEKYRSLGIYVYIFDKNKRVHTYFKPGKNVFARFDIKYINRLILFPSGTLGHPKLNELNKLIENPLFPEELVPDLSTFKFFSLTAEIGDFNRENFIFLSFDRIDKHDELNQTKFMKPNDEQETLKDFLSRIRNSVNSIEDWVNRETSIKIKLNLE